MEILKELNLNRNPQAVPNGSLVNAWNVKLSEDGTYLTADDSLHDVIENRITGNIVGVIPCNKEFVVLTDNNNIYRFKEADNGNIDEVVTCTTGWHYQGGEIKGTYSYNVNGHLIITIAENGNNVPLKTINLDKATASDFEDQYTPAPNIPIVNMTLVDRIAGTPIPQGLYYFFVRFKCQDETFTNWFPVGVPQYAVARVPLSVSVASEPTVYRGTDLSTTRLNKLTDDCPYGFKFRITIRNNNEYDKIQLGYILQHDNGNFGRKWNEIDLTNTDNSFEILFDALNPQEESIENLLENSINLFDVKSITTYENRLYVGNFKETNYDVEESYLKRVASEIQVKQYISDAEKFILADGGGSSSSPVEPVIVPGEVTSYDYEISIIDNYGFEHITTVNFAPNVNHVRLYDYTNNSQLAKIRECLRKAVIPTEPNSNYFRISYLTGNLITSASSQGNQFHEVGNYYLEEIQSVPYREQLYLNIPINAPLGESQQLTFSSENINDIVPAYAVFEREGDNPSNYVLRREYGEYQSGQLAGHFVECKPTDNEAGYWINGAVEDEIQNTSYFDTILGSFIKCSRMTIKKIAANTSADRIVIPDEDSSSEDYNESNTKFNIRIKNSVRSLMPNEVYSFYVHYVRADGSYTNGIKLLNDKATDFINVDDFGILDVNGKEISNKFVTNSFNNLRDLKNCELYTYGVLENTITDFAVYTNINNDKLFYTCSGYVTKSTDSYKICKIVPIFRNVKIPSGYVGVFFSYAKVDPLNIYYARIFNVAGSDALKYKASEVEAGVCTYRGSLYSPIRSNPLGFMDNIITDSNIYISNKPGHQFTDKMDWDSEINNMSHLSTFGCEGGIGLNVFDGDKNLITNPTLVGMPSGLYMCDVRRHDNSIYSNKDVNLISLGQILYGTNSATYDYGEILNGSNSPLAWEEFNYPSFVTKDKVFTYKRRIFISDDGGFYSATYNGEITKSDILSEQSNFIITSEIIKHSNFNLDALSLKKEPEFIVKGEASGISKVYYIVRPINMSDLFQFPGDFLERQYKAYTINDEKRYVEGHKNSVLRRSNVLGDESLENTLRYFATNDYKVLPRDKGKITNLLGLGYYFLIHTEHTLYAIDRNNLLKGETANVQLATPTTFDIDPKEMFTSSHGYGGMQTDSWTVNHAGYFFYDKDSIELYNVDNGNLASLTAPIKRILNKFNPEDAKFVTDFVNSRILISFRKNNFYLTLSYSIFTKKFISLHSFAFDYAYNTKNRPYIRLNNSNLLGTTNVLGDTSYRNYGIWLNNANGTLIKVTADTYAGENEFMPSVIDIMFNFNFEQVKTLNFVNWIIKLIQGWDNAEETNIADEENYSDFDEISDTLNRTNWYSGEVLRVYSDLTDSLDLDIEVGEKVNLFNNYKYPYFDRGEWNLNYFRNHLAKVITEEEKSKSKGKGTKVPDAVRSDNRGLLYGRYFVIRFVFGTKDKYNLPFRFNNVNIG